MWLGTRVLNSGCGVGLGTALLLLAGCASEGGGADSQNLMTQRAAEYCESVGGTTEVQETSLGTGRYCHLPDGRVENQWRLYRMERLDND
jgi:putative hemolysin